jgi:hypothetical protein
MAACFGNSNGAAASLAAITGACPSTTPSSNAWGPAALTSLLCHEGSTWLSGQLPSSLHCDATTLSIARPRLQRNCSDDRRRFSQTPPGRVLQLRRALSGPVIPAARCRRDLLQMFGMVVAMAATLGALRTASLTKTQHHQRRLLLPLTAAARDGVPLCDAGPQLQVPLTTVRTGRCVPRLRAR